MKVLHLPVNIASQVSVTVQALRDIGVEARGLVLPLATTQSGRNLEIIPVLSGRQPIERLTSVARRWKAIAEAIHWSDVVHWYFGRRLAPLGLDIHLVKILGKGRLVEFWGSDIRIPEVAASGNPYVAQLGSNHEYGDMESRSNSHETQSLFAGAGFEAAISYEELFPYVQAELFPRVHLVRQRALLGQYAPTYPAPHRRRPVIVHSPSGKVIKGTSSVITAIEQLRGEHDFEFVLNYGKSREEALQAVKGADVFLDQFVLGAYGLAAVEAMAFGKPVVCYIKPSLRSRYPSDLPIVDANRDNLSDVLERLITDGKLRHELGRRSRAYAEKHHDAHKIAHQLLAIYKELLSRQGVI